VHTEIDNIEPSTAKKPWLQAMDKGVHTKWSSRPGTAGSSRPGTAMPLLGGGGDGNLRPGTAVRRLEKATIPLNRELTKFWGRAQFEVRVGGVRSEEPPIPKPGALPCPRLRGFECRMPRIGR
jgi:hypothetical protein